MLKPYAMTSIWAVTLPLMEETPLILIPILLLPGVKATLKSVAVKPAPLLHELREFDSMTLTADANGDKEMVARSVIRGVNENRMIAMCCAWPRWWEGEALQAPVDRVALNSIRLLLYYFVLLLDVLSLSPDSHAFVTTANFFVRRKVGVRVVVKLAVDKLVTERAESWKESR